ncbi:MAG TPA: MaoC family dehydratase N-terminal domain-containing protein [Candidatus Binatia bacterium]|nr:MaoC family dehydratase N-terminal domain-containing protein [Candidatus Binatia bacterium]
MANRELIGREGKSSTAEVVAEEVAAFARAVGDLNPLYVDAAAAAKSRFGAVLAPPTFPIRMGAAAGDPDLFLALDLNFASLLHAEQEFEWLRPLVAGEKVTITGRVGDMWEKQGKSGTLDFVVLEQIARDAKGDTVYVARTTLISRRM